MQRNEKEEVIKDLNDKFTRAKAAILAEFSGVDVATVTNLRKKLREGKVEYKVLKNTLAKRAAKGTTVEQISDLFTGSVAMALSYDDVVAPAKIFTEFIKDLEKIKIRAAVIEGKKADVAGVKALAKMPGLNELRAKLMGMLMQPAGKLARTIKEPGAKLVRVIKARSEQAQK